MDDGGCLLYLIGGVLAIVAVIYLVIYVIVPLAAVTAGVGVCLGGGATIRNYYRSFRDNMFK